MVLRLLRPNAARAERRLRRLLHVTAIALGRTPRWEFPQKISMLRPTFAHRPASRRQIAPTRQMIFSPSPTAGRKIRVYVLKAVAVYQK